MSPHLELGKTESLQQQLLTKLGDHRHQIPSQYKLAAHVEAVTEPSPQSSSEKEHSLVPYRHV